MTLQPLRWAPDHHALIAPDGAYHRTWCPEANDDDGRQARFVDAGEALPHDAPPTACPRCRPTLVLRLGSSS